MNTDEPLMVKCRGGCGKESDLAYQVRIAKRLGMNGSKPKWQCAECYHRQVTKSDDGDGERICSYQPFGFSSAPTQLASVVLPSLSIRP